jgi:hypothetical protein
MGHLGARTLALVFIAALISGCSGGGTNPAVTTQSMVQHSADTTQSVTTPANSPKTKIKLLAPMRVTLTRTGADVAFTGTHCEHREVPKHLDKDGFPLDAFAFSPPHSATIAFTVEQFTNPCERHDEHGVHSDALHTMTVVGPTPTPAPPPAITGSGYYVVALDADASGRVSVVDVAGPASIDGDGTMHFAATWVPLSASDSYGFYLATVRVHAEGHGHDADEDDD